jgi:hypothetical protein
MEKKKLKLDNWPFEKREKVQLVWIGEPFKENNKWMIDTYFNNKKVTKKVIQDWANIHYLSIGKYYIDGNLVSSEMIDDNGVMEIKDIDLSGIKPKYNESAWNIKASSYKSKSRTFNFKKGNTVYSIPVIEIVKAVLAPNTFMLNTILYNDISEDYYTYNIENKVLKLYFTRQYKTSYLRSEYYNHLAWLISNKKALNIFNSIGYNMLNNKLMFDFQLDSFKIQARVKQNAVGYSVLEIIKVKEKRINVNEIIVYHPSFEEQEYTKKAKLRTYHKRNNDGDRTIDNNVDGSTNIDESLNTEALSHEYVNMPKVRKEKTGHRDKRTNEDESTKKYILEDNNSRTLADGEGLNLAKGIEMSNVDVGQVNGELKEFIDVLNKLKSMNVIKSVEINVVALPLGRKFSYLNDGVTRRRCVIGKVVTLDGREHSLIEVEREGKSLSMLIIIGSEQVDWAWVYKNLLNGLVRASGKWSNNSINKIKIMGSEIYRCNHIRKNKNDTARHVISKIY